MPHGASWRLQPEGADARAHVHVQIPNSMPSSGDREAGWTNEEGAISRACCRGRRPGCERTERTRTAEDATSPHANFVSVVRGSQRCAPAQRRASRTGVRTSHETSSELARILSIRVGAVARTASGRASAPSATGTMSSRSTGAPPPESVPRASTMPSNASSRTAVQPATCFARSFVRKPSASSFARGERTSRYDGLASTSAHATQRSGLARSRDDMTGAARALRRLAAAHPICGDSRVSARRRFQE